MLDKNSLEQYKAYRETIGSQRRKRTEDGIAQIRESLGMAEDLMGMLDILCHECEKQMSEISRLENDKRTLNEQLESATAKIEAFGEKEQFYSKLNLDSATLAALIRDNEEWARKLEGEQAKLKQERDNFEQEKTDLLAAKSNAEREAAEYQQKWTDEQNARQTVEQDRQTLLGQKKELEKQYEDSTRKALDEYDKLKERYDKLEAERNKLKVDLSQARKDCEWYQGYAEARDKDIIDVYARRNSRHLKAHYDTYLNNPDKWEEIKQRFPDFIPPETNGPKKAASPVPPEEKTVPSGRNDLSGTRTGYKKVLKAPPKSPEKEPEKALQNQEEITPDANGSNDAPGLSDANASNVLNNGNDENF